ncbi:MAG TPA: L-glutamate gamma-semialdehyde dehydrogenase, partial [Pirellulales bacterium]|nr:L-glutamate gamma-semialdehyde dehydrogenase [Pirellulales bacterium]
MKEDIRQLEDFSPQALEKIEAGARELGREIFDRIAHRQPSILERRWWDDRVMAWAMQDESVKVQMFRFIDVLPMLDSSAATVRHLQEYFHEVDRHLPGAVRLGLAVAAPHSIAGRALALAARRQAMGHARRFIAGTNSAEVLAAAMRERKLKRAFTLDILGEAVTSEIEADRYQQQYLELLEQLAPTVNSWP